MSLRPTIGHSPHSAPASRRSVPTLDHRAGRPAAFLIAGLVGLCLVTAIEPHRADASACNFLRLTASHRLFAVDPDLTIRRIDPRAPDNLWTLGETSGIPPLYSRTVIPGKFERVDFLFPFGFQEESGFRSKLRFSPFFESHWSKIPPFDGHSRVLTLYQGRSDLGQDYWGFFPLYGYMYRRYGVDRNFFFLFPLYYESDDDDAHTIRILWPLITYADSPGRSSLKFWPLIGRDRIGADYFNRFALWPLFQKIDKYPGTAQESSYLACPFPLYVQETDRYSSTTNLLWPFLSYYHHYKSGHERYRFWPFVTYGTGGGIEELSLFFVYSSRENKRTGAESGSGGGYVSIGDGEIFTERKFLLINTIQKRFRHGRLVFSRYRFWPFAEYTWDVEKGSHFKFPEVISLKSDFWDINLGRLLRFVDIRDTPITREISMLFGLSRRTEIKPRPHIPRPPKPGDDSIQELIMGAFNER